MSKEVTHGLSVQIEEFIDHCACGMPSVFELRHVLKLIDPAHGRIKVSDDERLLIMRRAELGIVVRAEGVAHPYLRFRTAPWRWVERHDFASVHLGEQGARFALEHVTKHANTGLVRPGDPKPIEIAPGLMKLEALFEPWRAGLAEGGA